MNELQKSYIQISNAIVIKHREVFKNLKKEVINHSDKFHKIFDSSKSKSYEYVIFDSIENISLKTWGALNVENNIFLSPEYFRALEKASPDEMEFRYAIILSKAKFMIFVLNPGFFEELKLNLKDKFTLDVYMVDNTIIGFTTRIYNGSTLEGYTHGMDYENNKRYELYQNMLFDDVKTGIESKSAQINLGRTSVAMKSSVGAVFEEMICLIQLRGKILNKMVKPIIYYLKPSEEYCRNPFEDDKE